MVSIFCTAFNHEKYIAKCLDGFVMQKTNFPFEVIVHDDASTDKTADIIREYESKYPDIIKPIYQTENQHSKGKKVTAEIIYPRSNGKYVAICEGDDFWIDETKLQKQFDVLESNLNCHACYCTVRDVNEDGSLRNTKHPNSDVDSGIISTEKFLMLAKDGYVFQTSSYFFRREYYDKFVNDPPEYRKISPVGDWPMMLYFSQVGDIYYIKDEMSCYRRNAIGSYTTSMSVSNIEKKKKYYKGLENTISTFDKCTDGRYHRYCEDISMRFRKYYFDCLLQERNFKEATKKEYKQFFKKESKKDKIAIYMTAYFPFIAKFIFKKK